MALFESQRILVISPQPWNHIHLSKHHYALELARQGNEVFFLGPPDESESGIRIEAVNGAHGLSVIHYRALAPLKLRFHVRPVFDFIQRRQLVTMLSMTGAIDVVWCFDFNTFSNLRAFNAQVSIFHPVDPVSEPSHIDVARSADVVLSVSREILESFAAVPVPQHVINHGLAPAFATLAARARDGAPRAAGPPRVGYAGNLARRPLGRDLLRKLVESNPNAEFHFWGPHEVLEGSSSELRSEVDEFVSFLRRSPNAKLHGRVSSDDLASQLQAMDCFILTYAAEGVIYDRSNSHKILEYLSTGKVVVSSRIARYAANDTLLRMPPDDDDDSTLPSILSDTLARLDTFNAPDQQRARRAIALDNTYAKQVDRIRDILLGLPERAR